jgi:hypothetical protein
MRRQTTIPLVGMETRQAAFKRRYEIHWRQTTIPLVGMETRRMAGLRRQNTARGAKQQSRSSGWKLMYVARIPTQRVGRPVRRQTTIPLVGMET